MKKHYIGLWLLLASAFAIFAIASAFDEIKIGGVSLKSAGIFNHLTAVPDSAKLADDEALAFADTLPAQPSEPERTPIDTAAKTILIVGDSMLEGLSPRLADYAAANGHELYTVIWYSSTTAVWGQSNRLAEYIQRLHPDYIFISLGANELFVSNIKEKRRDFVKHILSQVDTIPYVWIGPPNWKPDTGINELVEESVGNGNFFCSNGMHFDRAKDGAHPTRSSAALWMDSVARWMPEHAAHPILMEHPGQVKGKPKRIFVHQPNEK